MKPIKSSRRFKIGVKICLLTSAIILTTSIVTWLSLNALGTDVLLTHERIDHDDDTHLGGRSLLANIQALREDARKLARQVGHALGNVEAPVIGEDAARGRIEGVLAEFLETNSADGPTNHATKKTWSAYRHGVEYSDASFWRTDGGSIGPLAPKRSGEERPRTPMATGPFQAAMELGPQEVRLSEIDPKSFQLHALVPVYPRDAGKPAGVIRLTLDLKNKFDQLTGDPRMIAFLANETGRILTASYDLKLNPQEGISLRDIKEFTRDPENSADESGSLHDLLTSTTANRGLQAQEQDLNDTGILVDYIPSRTMYLLAIDIDKGKKPSERVSKSFLEGLQRFLDGFHEKNPELVRQTGLAQDWPDYYPYAYVRSTSSKELEAIRDQLENHPDFGGRTESRRIVDFERFFVRFVKLPFDPDQPGRFLTLGLGMSEQEIRGDFAKEAIKLTIPLMLVLGSGVAITFLFSLILTNPLKRMTLAAEGFSAGRYEADLPVKANDEIGVLARAFQVMGARVRAKTDELQAAAARTQTILDTAAEGIVTIDTGGVIESFNRAAEHIFGYAASEVLDRHIDILLPTPADSQRSSELSRIVAIGQTRPEAVIGRAHELTGRRKDGSEFPMEISIGEVDLGDRRLFTSIVRDITERKHVEESLRAAEERQRRLNEELDRRVTERTGELEHAKADLERSNQELSAARDATEAAMQAQVKFFDDVAHDLRTPLTNVIGYSQDLLQQASGLGYHQFVTDLKLVVDQGKFLNELINDLLNVSKAMSGKELALELSEFDVPTMLRERLPGLHYLADRNDNTVELDCPDDLGTMIADEVRVWRILMNLLTNSCKFTNNGTIRVSARRQPGPSPSADQFVFQVADTGIGMSPNQVARLFNRFEQVHAHSATQGFGLGLSTCSLYCRTMGGEIRVESEAGKGSTFTIRLPAVVKTPGTATPSRIVPPEPAPSPAEPSIAGAHGEELVLIIDDDPSGGELMRRNLAEQGIHVRVALSGEQGLLLAKQLRPAAILLDVVMPGIDGWAVLAALKTDTATADIPIIMVTIVDDRARGFALGANDYAIKPLARDRLAELLRKHLSARGTERILVVEDNTEMRDRLVRILKEQGFEVTQATDGQQALESVAAARPHLILLDLMLPQMSGFEVVERIRRNPSWQDIPIIVVSGAEIDTEGRRRLQGQVKHFLQKGLYGRDELFREVRTVLTELRHPPSAVLEKVDAQDSYG